MELRHLRYFEAIAATGNVTRAAETLHISQPALSQAIKELEADVGQQLLVRGPRGAVLTDAGREFSKHASDILARVPQARDAARQAALGTGGQLTVGFTGSSAFDVVPHLVRQARIQLPGVALRLLEMLTDKQIEALAARRIDVAIGRPLRDEPGLTSKIIGNRSFVAALPTDHPLARRRSLSLADLHEVPLIVPQRRLGPGFNIQLMAMFAKAHANLRVAHETTHMPTVLALVAAGLGIGIVSDELRHVKMRDVVYRPLDEGRDGVQLALSWRHDDDSATLTAFVAMLSSTPPARMRAV